MQKQAFHSSIQLKSILGLLILSASLLVQSCNQSWDDDQKFVPTQFTPLYWLADSSQSVLGSWPNGQTFNPLPFTGYITDVAPDGQSIWLTTRQPNRIYQLNRANNAIELTHELGTWQPTAIAITAKHLWIGESSGNRLIAFRKNDLAKDIKIFHLPEQTAQIIANHNKVYLRQTNGTIRLWLENAFAEIWQGRVKGNSRWFGFDSYKNVSILASDSINQWMNSSIDANGNVFTSLDKPTNIIQLALTPYTSAPYEREYIRDIWLNNEGITSLPQLGNRISRISMDFAYSELAFVRQDSLFVYDLKPSNRSHSQTQPVALGFLGTLRLRDRY